MSFAKWLNEIKNAEKTSIIQGRVRKVHYKMPNGRQMAEEYSMDTGIILKRTWKKENLLGGEAQWELEFGDIVRPLHNTNDSLIVKESITEPILSKRITKTSIEWRIRNLPYPIEFYSVTVDDKASDYSITIRTSNKKYFKQIRILELERCETVPDQKLISLQHQNNTLIITYKKPQILIEMEKMILLVLKDVETETDLDVDCNDLLKQLMG